MKSSKQGNPKKLLGLCRFIRMGDSSALGIIFNRFDEISWPIELNDLCQESDTDQDLN